MRILIVLFFTCIVNNVFSQIDTITWERKTSLPDSFQRTGCGFFLLDSDFYVVGGQAGSSAYSLSAVWKYHIPTDSWTQMRNLSFGPTGSGGSFVLNGKGYFLADRDSISNNNCDTLFWQYDPTNDTWTSRASFPDAPRNNSSFFSYAGKGYVGQTFGCGGIPDSHFWGYDPVLNKWFQVATQPDNVSAGSGVAAISANAYLIGGYNNLGNNLSDFWQYNILNNSWDSIGQMPGTSRAYSVIWGFDSVLIGGGGDDGYTLFNDFYKYDVARNLWTPIAFQNSFDSTGGGGAFVFNKRGYYFGGEQTLNPIQSFNNKMWSFDASKFFPPDTSVGIRDLKNEVAFSVYPNPINREQGFSVSTSESGSILFYDALGRVLDERKLSRGLNQIKLTTDNEVIFYRATLYDGSTQNGKLVLIK